MRTLRPPSTEILHSIINSLLVTVRTARYIPTQRMCLARIVLTVDLAVTTDLAIYTTGRVAYRTVIPQRHIAYIPRLGIPPVPCP